MQLCSQRSACYVLGVRAHLNKRADTRDSGQGGNSSDRTGVQGAVAVGARGRGRRDKLQQIRRLTPQRAAGGYGSQALPLCVRQR